MKVFSLYHHNETYVASFKTREDAIFYGKQFYEDGWECNIIEEYLSKSPPLYSTPYTPPNPHPHCYTSINSVKPEPYKDVRAYWDL
jgi:hypothetical protein